MSSERVPSTPAVLALRAAKIEFTPHFYNINGGSRGFLVRLAPEALVRLLAAQPVDVAIPL
jgi:prolyl-tRNA editing enzyme YbaK/EbsC (Cys-tRNA(Pro) deacylase)